jgi:hypothetical protein
VLYSERCGLCYPVFRVFWVLGRAIEIANRVINNWWNTEFFHVHIPRSCNWCTLHIPQSSFLMIYISFLAKEEKSCGQVT